MTAIYLNIHRTGVTLTDIGGSSSIQSLVFSLFLVCILIIWATIFYLIMKLVILGYRSRTWALLVAQLLSPKWRKSPGRFTQFVGLAYGTGHFILCMNYSEF